MYKEALDGKVEKTCNNVFEQITIEENGILLCRVHCVMRFKDRHVLRVHRKDVLSALSLCPGEQVSVHCGKQTYQWAMVLEYTSKCDRFLMAYSDGTIFK